MYAQLSGLTAFHGQRTKKHTLSSFSLGAGAGVARARSDGGRFSGGECQAGRDGDFFRVLGIGDDCLRTEPGCSSAVLDAVRGNPWSLGVKPAAAVLVSNAGVAARFVAVSGFSVLAVDQSGSA